MADHLVDGPSSAKRPKLDPFVSQSDSTAFNHYGLSALQSDNGGGAFNARNQWNYSQQNALTNVDMLGLEKDLPDELELITTWGPNNESLNNVKPQAQGPGSMPNGIINTDDNSLRHMHIAQIIQQNNKGLSNALLTGGQIGSKSPNIPNVSVARAGGGVVDQLNIGSLAANNVGLQAVANNGSNAQVMSSIQGLSNTAGGSLIMTNSNMNSLGNMGGGGLVVSSGVSKPQLVNTPNLMGNQPPHHGGPHHSMPQGMQNGPLLNRLSHLQQQRASPNIHIGGTRLQNPNILLSGHSGMLANSPYPYANSNPDQSSRPCVVTPQQKINIPGTSPRFNGPQTGGPVSGPMGGNGPMGGDGGIVQTQPPAPSPAQPQSGAPSVSQPGPQQATTSQAGQPGAPPTPSTDPEKRKLIQQQLVLLLHAHKCQRRQSSQANGEPHNCSLPHCQTMKNVLNHMTTCSAGRSCSIAHCSSSRQIISHWKNCVRHDCPVCLPLKQADRRNPTSSAATQNATQTPPVNTSEAQVRRNYDNLSLQSPAGVAAAAVAAGGGGGSQPSPAGILPVGANQPRPHIRLPTNVNSGMQARGPAQTVLIRGMPPTSSNQGVTANVNLPLGSDPTPNVLQQVQSLNQQSATFQQNVANVMIGLASGAEAANQGLVSQLPGGLQPSQVTASPVTGTKEWHQSVTTDLRNHLVHKLVQAIFPTPDPSALLDKRMHNLVAYAKKVEGDMYEAASSRSEYYHLLAEKIYKIQKELEEKRQKRKELQLQQQQQQQQQQQLQQTQQQQGIRSTNQGLARSAINAIQTQQSLRSSWPTISNNINNTLNIINQQGNQMVYTTQQQTGGNQSQNVQQQQQQQQQQSQQLNLTALPGPSPTTSNPGLSPFGNPLSQGSTSSTQFSSNGPISLPQVSPAGNQQQNQFDLLKNNRITTPTPSPGFMNQQQMTPQMQQQQNTPNINNNLNGAQQPNGVANRLPSISDKSMNASAGASPASVPPSSVQASPSTVSSLGKGMSTAERAALSAPRQSSTTSSSQMAALRAAASEDNDETSPTTTSDNKGKLDQMKIEPMDIKQEHLDDSSESDNHQNSNSSKCGVNGNNNNTDVKMEIKTEIKMEPNTETSDNSCDQQHGEKPANIKDEPCSSVADVKPLLDDSQSSAGSVEPAKTIKLFKPDELRQKLMPTLEKLYKHDPESIPFRQPVDPQTLCIPDYFDIVKKPMDLSTIKRKLDIGQYLDPWEYVDDVWLMFDNAWLYNRKTSRVYRYCTKLSEIFEQDIDPVMQSMGYCCGRKYTFNPQVLCCYGKQLCTIPRDAKYYSYQNSLKGYGLGPDRYTYCQKCFNDIQGDTVTLGDDSSQAQNSIKKDQFQEMKNDHLEMEEFVNCSDCGRKVHKICVLHHSAIWPQGYTCDECLKKKNVKRRENKFNAKRLPVTNLGVYIESRVNTFLKKKEAGAGEVHIRVVSSSDKVVEVKPGMRSKFVETGDLAAEFPYRAKALFAFEEIDGVDVCFFGMHVQEYGSECPAPNTRRVYIAYLDSVHFFKPKQYRTAVYHEILLSYLDYVKQLGYTMAHIWACPPSEGDDYIFHCHPPDQKIPKPKRLQDWYKKMLDKGIIERIIVDYKDILKQAAEDMLKTAADLPYFEGDFWPNVLEESIKELDQEEEEKRKQAEAAEAIFSNMEESEVGPEGKKKGQKKAKKNTKSKANQRKNSNKKSNTPQIGNDLSDKIFATMEKHKEVFFVIRLHSVQSAASLKAIQDPDAFINCDLMDGRDAFLTLAREKHYEFSSLRRAKYSTMCMLYELHNQSQDKFDYTCNECKSHVDTRYHCTICEDFDLCVPCYEKVGHPHKMEQLGFGLDDANSPSDNNKANPQEARKLSIQRCIQSLVHAVQCRDANCRLPSCAKMRRVVNHTRNCKRKTNGGCPICKQLIALCCYHAKNCQETKCLVPFCPNIKYKLKQQQLQQRLQQKKLLRRRMAVMSRTSGNTMAGASNSSVPMNTGSGQVLPRSVSPGGMVNSGMFSKGLPNPSMGIQSHQSGVGMKPGTQTPPANVLQVVKQVQEEAARQQAPHGGYGKSMPPQGAGQNMPPPSMRGTPGHLGVNQGGNLLPMEQWQRYRPSVQPGLNPGGVPMGGMPPNIQAGPVGQPVVGGMRTVAATSTAGGVAGNSNQMMQRQALQQLMQTLKSPTHPDQQGQILSILKSNPQLMAAFIKQRASQQMQGNAGGVGGNSGNPVQQQQQQQQQLPHMLGQPNPAAQQIPNRMAMQMYIAQQQQQQQQQQQASFQQAASYQQRLPGIRQQINYSNTFNDQQYSMHGMKPTPTPIPSPQGIMGPPQGQGISSVTQLMQSVRSPPPIRSPQPSPSSRPSSSPRNQTVPSPRGPQPSPHDLAPSEILLGQNHSNALHSHLSPTGTSNQDSDMPPMTPQDQLSKFVEQL